MLALPKSSRCLQPRPGSSGRAEFGLAVREVGGLLEAVGRRGEAQHVELGQELGVALRPGASGLARGQHVVGEKTDTAEAAAVEGEVRGDALQD